MKTKGTKKIVLLSFLALAIVSICLVGISTDNRWGLLPIIAALATTVCLPHLLILLHELGHAATAWVLGIRVFGVYIGRGKVLFRKEWRGTIWEIRFAPMSGLALCGHTTRKWFRTKQMVMVAGGPMVSLITLLACIYFLNSSLTEGISLPARETIDMLGNLACWIQAVVFLGTLWPRRSTIYGAVQQSDGLQLLRTPFLKDTEIELSLAKTYAREGEFAARAGRTDEAFNWFSRGLQQYPGNWFLHYISGLCYLAKERQPEGIDHLMKALESSQVSTSLRVKILDTLACVPLYSGRADYLKEADGWSLRALEIEPSSYTLKGTRGSVLVRLGRLQEGRDLLQEVLQSSASDNDKSVSACFLSLAASKQHNAEEAAKMLQLAKTLNPQCRILQCITEQGKGSTLDA